MCWWEVLRSGTNRLITQSPSKMSAGNLNLSFSTTTRFNLGTMLSCSGPAHTTPPTLILRSQPKQRTNCVSSPYGTGSDPNPAKHPLALLLLSLLVISWGQQAVILPLGRRVHRKDGNQRRSRAPLTWSNSCFPVVLGWMANSSSASMVVTRTLICREGQRAMRNNLLILLNLCL